ncbi:hypothetical protein KGF57_002453 [Candida theae]|uniref:Uncharacterized protein n=1 Tax=Candida theae TaxID=1198502 RepID=A0AAD5BF30_9ASCO|nr:uncharacterized protein KGF57_002453 [Candida theae]KAI5958608.1 hypothetical protein KGF57_002453 [Candida theae]
MHSIQHQVAPSPLQHHHHHHQQQQQQQPHRPHGDMQEPRGYQKQPKHSPILTIKNLFDIQSESSSPSPSPSATSSLHSDHSMQSKSTPFNRSNTSSISTCDNNHQRVHNHGHSHNHKTSKRLGHGLSVTSFCPRDDYPSEFEDSPLYNKVILEVYEQEKKKSSTTKMAAAIESHTSPLSTLNFNFDFDNWSLDELPPMDDGKFSDRIQHNTCVDPGPEPLSSLPLPEVDFAQEEFSGKEVKDHSLELNSTIESMKELTLLNRFKGMIRKNSSNMFKRLNSSSFDLLLFRQGGDGKEDVSLGVGVGVGDRSTGVLASSSLSNLPSPSKIKFEEHITDLKEVGSSHTMPSASTCTPTPITPNNYHPTPNCNHHNHIRHHHNRHQKRIAAQLSASSSSPKRKKSFLNFRSNSLPFNFFDFKLNGNNSLKKHNCPFLDPPKSILKCKVNQNYNQESIESLKQDSMQFDEFWRKFELMEQAKNNYTNDELLNTMRLEQVRNYYYGN